MKYVQELYDRHPNSDIYIVGTGASLRVFPESILKGRITIGLNMAWRLIPITYGITIHPELNIPEFLPGEKPRPEIVWVTKHIKSGSLDPRDQKYAEDNFYFFESQGQRNSQPLHEPSDSGRILEWVDRPSGSNLYQWSSISQTAANLAANMGAKNIFLVGCDNASLVGSHHAESHHTRWKGVNPDHRYKQYYEGLSEIRRVLRDRNVTLISLTPFLRLSDHEQEFVQLCDELGKPVSVDSSDVSPPIPLRARLVSARNRVLAKLERIRLRGDRPRT